MIWLIGFRAAGKTTVGKALAERLGQPFTDCDDVFEKRHGNILTFVDRHGVENFRREEEAVLREMSGGVIATGGGFVDWEPSRKFLESSPFPKLWLDPPAAVLWARLEKEPSRRKIGDLQTFDAMCALLEKRRPFYEKIATFRTETQDISECLALISMSRWD